MNESKFAASNFSNGDFNKVSKQENDNASKQQMKRSKDDRNRNKSKETFHPPSIPPETQTPRPNYEKVGTEPRSRPVLKMSILETVQRENIQAVATFINKERSKQRQHTKLVQEMARNMIGSGKTTGRPIAVRSSTSISGAELVSTLKGAKHSDSVSHVKSNGSIKSRAKSEPRKIIMENKRDEHLHDESHKNRTHASKAKEAEFTDMGLITKEEQTRNSRKRSPINNKSKHGSPKSHITNETTLIDTGISHMKDQSYAQKKSSPSRITNKEASSRTAFENQAGDVNESVSKKHRSSKHRSKQTSPSSAIRSKKDEHAYDGSPKRKTDRQKKTSPHNAEVQIRNDKPLDVKKESSLKTESLSGSPKSNIRKEVKFIETERERQTVKASTTKEEDSFMKESNKLLPTKKSQRSNANYDEMSLPMEHRSKQASPRRKNSTLQKNMEHNLETDANNFNPQFIVGNEMQIEKETKKAGNQSLNKDVLQSQENLANYNNQKIIDTINPPLDVRWSPESPKTRPIAKDNILQNVEKANITGLMGALHNIERNGEDVNDRNEKFLVVKECENKSPKNRIGGETAVKQLQRTPTRLYSGSDQDRFSNDVGDRIVHECASKHFLLLKEQSGQSKGNECGMCPKADKTDGCPLQSESPPKRKRSGSRKGKKGGSGKKRGGGCSDEEPRSPSSNKSGCGKKKGGGCSDEEPQCPPPNKSGGGKKKGGGCSDEEPKCPPSNKSGCGKKKGGGCSDEEPQCPPPNKSGGGKKKGGGCSDEEPKCPPSNKSGCGITSPKRAEKKCNPQPEQRSPGDNNRGLSQPVRIRVCSPQKESACKKKKKKKKHKIKPSMSQSTHSFSSRCESPDSNKRSKSQDSCRKKSRCTPRCDDEFCAGAFGGDGSPPPGTTTQPAGYFRGVFGRISSAVGGQLQFIACNRGRFHTPGGLGFYHPDSTTTGWFDRLRCNIETSSSGSETSSPCSASTTECKKRKKRRKEKDHDHDTDDTSRQMETISRDESKQEKAKEQKKRSEQPKKEPKKEKKEKKDAGTSKGKGKEHHDKSIKQRVDHAPKDDIQMQESSDDQQEASSNDETPPRVEPKKEIPVPVARKRRSDDKLKMETIAKRDPLKVETIAKRDPLKAETIAKRDSLTTNDYESTHLSPTDQSVEDDTTTLHDHVRETTEKEKKDPQYPSAIATTPTKTSDPRTPSCCETGSTDNSSVPLPTAPRRRTCQTEHPDGRGILLSSKGCDSPQYKTRTSKGCYRSERCEERNVDASNQSDLCSGTDGAGGRSYIYGASPTSAHQTTSGVSASSYEWKAGSPKKIHIISQYSPHDCDSRDERQRDNCPIRFKKDLCNDYSCSDSYSKCQYITTSKHTSDNRFSKGRNCAPTYRQHSAEIVTSRSMLDYPSPPSKSYVFKSSEWKPSLRAHSGRKSPRMGSPSPCFDKKKRRGDTGCESRRRECDPMCKETPPDTNVHTSGVERGNISHLKRMCTDLDRINARTRRNMSKGGKLSATFSKTSSQSRHSNTENACGSEYIKHSSCKSSQCTEESSVLSFNTDNVTSESECIDQSNVVYSRLSPDSLSLDRGGRRGVKPTRKYDESEKDDFSDVTIQCGCDSSENSVSSESSDTDTEKQYNDRCRGFPDAGDTDSKPPKRKVRGRIVIRQPDSISKRPGISFQKFNVKLECPNRERAYRRINTCDGSFQSNIVRNRTSNRHKHTDSDSDRWNIPLRSRTTMPETTRRAYEHRNMSSHFGDVTSSRTFSMLPTKDGQSYELNTKPPPHQKWHFSAKPNTENRTGRQTQKQKIDCFEQVITPEQPAPICNIESNRSVEGYCKETGRHMKRIKRSDSTVVFSNDTAGSISAAKVQAEYDQVCAFQEYIFHDDRLEMRKPPGRQIQASVFSQHSSLCDTESDNIDTTHSVAAWSKDKNASCVDNNQSSSAGLEECEVQEDPTHRDSGLKTSLNPFHMHMSSLINNESNSSLGGLEHFKRMAEETNPPQTEIVPICEMLDNLHINKKGPKQVYEKLRQNSLRALTYASIMSNTTSNGYLPACGDITKKAKELSLEVSNSFSSDAGRTIDSSSLSMIKRDRGTQVNFPKSWSNLKISSCAQMSYGAESSTRLDGDDPVNQTQCNGMYTPSATTFQNYDSCCTHLFPPMANMENIQSNYANELSEMMEPVCRISIIRTVREQPLIETRDTDEYNKEKVMLERYCAGDFMDANHNKEQTNVRQLESLFMNNQPIFRPADLMVHTKKCASEMSLNGHTSSPFHFAGGSNRNTLLSGYAYNEDGHSKKINCGSVMSDVNPSEMPILSNIQINEGRENALFPVEFGASKPYLAHLHTSNNSNHEPLVEEDRNKDNQYALPATPTRSIQETMKDRGKSFNYSTGTNSTNISPSVVNNNKLTSVNQILKTTGESEMEDAKKDSLLDWLKRTLVKELVKLSPEHHRPAVRRDRMSLRKSASTGSFIDFVCKSCPDCTDTRIPKLQFDHERGSESSSNSEESSSYYGVSLQEEQRIKTLEKLGTISRKKYYRQMYRCKRKLFGRGRAPFNPNRTKSFQRSSVDWEHLVKSLICDDKSRLNGDVSHNKHSPNSQGSEIKTGPASYGLSKDSDYRPFLPGCENKMFSETGIGSSPRKTSFANYQTVDKVLSTTEDEPTESESELNGSKFGISRSSRDGYRQIEHKTIAKQNKRVYHAMSPASYSNTGILLTENGSSPARTGPPGNRGMLSAMELDLLHRGRVSFGKSYEFSDTGASVPPAMTTRGGNWSINRSIGSLFDQKSFKSSFMKNTIKRQAGKPEMIKYNTNSEDLANTYINMYLTQDSKARKGKSDENASRSNSEWNVSDVDALGSTRDYANDSKQNRRETADDYTANNMYSTKRSSNLDGAKGYKSSFLQSETMNYSNGWSRRDDECEMTNFKSNSYTMMDDYGFPDLGHMLNMSGLSPPQDWNQSANNGTEDYSPSGILSVCAPYSNNENDDRDLDDDNYGDNDDAAAAAADDDDDEDDEEEEEKEEEEDEDEDDDDDDDDDDNDGGNDGDNDDDDDDDDNMVIDKVPIVDFPPSDMITRRGISRSDAVLDLPSLCKNEGNNRGKGLPFLLDHFNSKLKKKEKETHSEPLYQPSHVYKRDLQFAEFACKNVNSSGNIFVRSSGETELDEGNDGKEDEYHSAEEDNMAPYLHRVSVKECWAPGCSCCRGADGCSHRRLSISEECAKKHSKGLHGDGNCFLKHYPGDKKEVKAMQHCQGKHHFEALNNACEAICFSNNRSEQEDRNVGFPLYAALSEKCRDAPKIFQMNIGGAKKDKPYTVKEFVNWYFNDEEKCARHVPSTSEQHNKAVALHSHNSGTKHDRQISSHANDLSYTGANGDDIQTAGEKNKNVKSGGEGDEEDKGEVIYESSSSSEDTDDNSDDCAGIEQLGYRMLAGVVYKRLNEEKRSGYSYENKANTSQQENLRKFKAPVKRKVTKFKRARIIVKPNESSFVRNKRNRKCHKMEKYDEVSDSASLDNIQVPQVGKERVRFACDKNGEWAEIGRGSYGCVYLGLLDGKIEVAIKDFYESNSYDQVIHEAKMLVFLQNTGITPKFYGLRRRFDVTKQPGEYCIIMEYFGEGKTLFNVLSDKIELATSEWMDVLGQLVAGLRLIHRRNVLLNDLKADNILIDLNGGRKTIRYIDVGMATYKKGLTFQLPQNQMGKYNFLAPEARDGLRTSKRSDIYSLGYMLDQIMRVAGEALSGLEGLVTYCMQDDPKKRPSVNDIVARVHTFIDPRSFLKNNAKKKTIPMSNSI